MTPENATDDLRINVDELYREEIFTDRRTGTIRRLTPVTRSGATDNTRNVLYVGQAQILTPVGAMPLSFELDGQSLAEAAENFPEAAKEALDHTLNELKEMQREAASSIIVPEAGAGFGDPGGVPGRGKIQFR